MFYLHKNSSCDNSYITECLPITSIQYNSNYNHKGGLNPGITETFGPR